ncbi:MAG: hypothetical protein BWX92_00979 [Deltaproteobacteria bacterium ADurb.Bin135]|nr:MAG: hypothetical protein BWX92_00979 [Deltaproteobacteria bacterium ADurb.Bin135]
MMINNKNDHKMAGVPQDISGNYYVAIARYGNPVHYTKAFVVRLDKIIRTLYRI